jgi:DNA-binding transcriptional regulator GbsR (MarR family)
MTTTSDEVWQLFRELIESQKETDREIKELREAQKETDRQIKASQKKPIVRSKN